MRNPDLFILRGFVESHAGRKNKDAARVGTRPFHPAKFTMSCLPLHSPFVSA